MYLSFRTHDEAGYKHSGSDQHHKHSTGKLDGSATILLHKLF